MSEPPQTPSAVGIEAVGWSPRGDGGMTVQVTGRWRRRRPLGGSQPRLVLEIAGQRHRFPAMPEPPGLTGAAPGTWQMSFSVPPELVPGPEDRAWLQVGAVVVPLPVTAAGSSAARRKPQPALPEPVTDPAPDERVSELMRELEQARAAVAAHDASRRAAEQQAHAERVRAAELGEELARLASEHEEDAGGSDAELAAARARVAELEEEIDIWRRRLDEAEQLAAAAEAARRRASLAREAGEREARRRPRVLAGERAMLVAALEARPRAPEAPAHGVPAAEADRRWIEVERRVLAHRARPGTARPAAPAPAPESTGPRLGAVLAAVREELVKLRVTSRQDREARAAAESRAAAAEARAAAAEAERTAAGEHAAATQRRLAEVEARSIRAFEALDGLRLEIAGIRTGVAPAEPFPVPPARLQPQPEPPAAAPPPGPPAAAPPPEPPTGSPTGPPPDPGPPVPLLDLSRLDAARSRLRAAEAATPAPTPAAVVKPWLKPAFRALAAADPVTAGRLALALLPAQHLVHPGPLRYDLILEDIGCLQVDVDDVVHIRLGHDPRAPAEVDFAVRGDLAGLARLLADGSTRRRPRSARARIRGDRVAARALLGLVRLTHRLDALLDAGVTLDAWMALSLAARMLGPAVAVPERHAIAFHGDDEGGAPLLLSFGGGRAAGVTPGVGEAVAETEVVVPAGTVGRLLTGHRAQDVRVLGDELPLSLLQREIERAQSG